VVKLKTMKNANTTLIAGIIIAAVTILFIRSRKKSKINAAIEPEKIVETENEQDAPPVNYSDRTATRNY
jgi:LPXTG-motif cell wall-anchored protein